MNKKRKATKKITAWLMCLAMVLTLVPMNKVTVHAEDENIIYEVEAVGIKQPVFGEVADFTTTLTVPDGANYTATLIDYPVSPGNRYSREDVTYTFQIAYRPNSGYKFPKSSSLVNATLNGVDENTYSVEKSNTSYSEDQITIWYKFDFDRMHYVLNEFNYSIPASRVGVPINPIVLPTNDAISGGTAPYTFEKIDKEGYLTSEWDWVNVSESGVITGTPTKRNDAYKFAVWVRVTDATGKQAEFSVPASEVIDAGEADKIYDVTAIGINQPVFGEVADFSTTLTTPADANYTASLETYPVTPGNKYLRDDVTYIFKVGYIAKSGYTFATSSSQISTSLEGIDPNTYSVEKSKGGGTSITVWYSFDFDLLHYNLNKMYYSIPDSRVGLAISPIALPTGSEISGGTGPYTFEKVDDEDHDSLDWIRVSQDGIITGTPIDVSEQKANGLWVKITDAKKKSCLFTLDVGQTIMGGHVHNYATSWSGDEFSHWKECECGNRTEEADHEDLDNNKKCDICGMNIHQHNGTPVAQVDATCTEYGVKAYYVCSCGRIFEDSAYTKKITNLTTWKSGEGRIEKKSHSYIVEQTAEIPATCVDDGTTAVKKCATCTATQGGETIPATGVHSYTVEQTAEVPATCITDGTTAVMKCATCTATTGGTTILALGHDYKVTDNVASSETVAGYTEYTCARCTDSYKDPKPLADHVHDWIEDAEVPATCATDGIGAGKHCSKCSDTDGYAVIPATGVHSYTVEKTAKIPATCTTDGAEAVMKCAGCDATIGGETIPATGHSYASVWTSNEKSHWHACTACGDKKEESTHTFDAGKVTKEATETAEGIKTYTCSVCGKTKTETIPKKEATKPDDKKPEAPKKGDALKDDKTGVQVKVLDPDKKEVVFVAPKDAKAKAITVPATITVNGVTYKVTKINDGAFKGNKTVTKIVLPSSITVIGKDAFNGCSKLKTLTIKTSKLTDKNVGSKAFKGINAKAKVKVPKSKLKAYKKILKKKGISGKNQKITK